MWLFKLVLCLLAAVSAQSHPFKNIRYALRGYNIRKGDPFENHGDPGFASQIFLESKTKNGKTVLQDGITASSLSNCKKYMKSRAFTDLHSYRNYVTSSSSSGVNLQVGTETEVTAGINVIGIKIGAKKTIPPAFTRAWSESRGMKKLEEFFKRRKGMVTLIKGTCTVYEMALNTFHLPQFRAAYRSALRELFKVTKKGSSKKRKTKFQNFIGQYGTHFLLKARMGAQFMHETRYSSSARRKFTTRALEVCNEVNGAKIFGIQVEKDRAKCTSSDLRKLHEMGRTDVEQIVITKGSRPTDINDWSKQIFTPVPLKFQLSPIINLFANKHIRAANIVLDGKRIKDGKKLRKWFVPLYYKFCKTMGIKKSECLPKKGCGYDDHCPLDTRCRPGSRSFWCSKWSRWTCTAKCGKGYQQQRTRKCSGCIGQLTERRKAKCGRLPPCYKKYSSSVHYTPFNSDGGGNAVYLDRHHMRCLQGKVLSGFHLQRNNAGNKIRYQYWCSPSQLPCKNIYTKTNDRTHNGRGNLIYLDRQYVRCNNDDYLQNVRLHRLGIKSWYRYGCCRMQHPQSCVHRWTKFTYDGKGTVIHLDRQTVRCPWNHSLSGFRLQRNDKNGRSIRYYYKCCRTLPLSG